MGASHSLAPYTVRIARGDGLVARFGDVVMFIADATASVDRLLAAIDSVSDSENPGAVVAQRLASLATGADSDQVGPFGIVAPTTGGLLVLLRGNVVAEIDAAQDTHELSGERAFTWVDEVVPAPVRWITVTGRSRASAHPHTDLRAGVVQGGGFALFHGGATEERPVGAESVAAETMRGQETTLRAPSPIETAPHRQSPTETAAYVPVSGFLESEDGAIYPLDRNYVIGRDPLRDEAARSAAASPIVVQHDQHISRVHAYISIEGSTVFVSDATTPGGTFIAAPGAEDWTRISAAPTELEPGWSLRVGDRTLTYRTGNRG